MPRQKQALDPVAREERADEQAIDRILRARPREDLVDQVEWDPLFGISGWLQARYEAQEKQYAYLWKMTKEQRIAASRSGKLSFAAMIYWSNRAPEEPPLLGGEYEFIARLEPDHCEPPEPRAPGKPTTPIPAQPSVARVDHGPAPDAGHSIDR